MTEPFRPTVDRAPAALVAVLHEAGPRAAVLVELLCGDGRQADVVLAQAVQSLGRELAQGPVARWNRRFWTLLMAAPALRSGRPLPSSLPAFVDRLTPGLRLVLLLRVVAGLDAREAGAVLGMPTGRYEAALHRTLPRTPDGRLDPVAWQALSQACDARVRQAFDARAGQLDRLFALAAGPGVRRPSIGALRAPLLRLALAACIVALAATWWIRPGHRDDPSVRVTALPAAAAPASTYDGDTAVLTDPDFDALADPRDHALAADMDLYAWYAARVASEAGPGAPVVFPDAALPAPDATDLTTVPHASR